MIDRTVQIVMVENAWNGATLLADGSTQTLTASLAGDLVQSGRARYVDASDQTSLPGILGNLETHAAEHAEMGGVVLVVAQSAVATTITGTTAETTMASIAVPAMGANDSLRVTAMFTYTSSTNAKTQFFKLNNSTFGQNATSTSGHTITRMQVQITNRNSVSSQLGNLYGMGWTAGTAATAMNTTVDTSGENTLLIRGQLGSGAESMTLEGYTVELIRAP